MLVRPDYASLRHADMLAGSIGAALWSRLVDAISHAPNGHRHVLVHTRCRSTSADEPGCVGGQSRFLGHQTAAACLEQSAGSPPRRHNTCGAIPCMRVGASFPCPRLAPSLLGGGRAHRPCEGYAAQSRTAAVKPWPLSQGSRRPISSTSSPESGFWIVRVRPKPSALVAVTVAV